MITLIFLFRDVIFTGLHVLIMLIVFLYLCIQGFLFPHHFHFYTVDYFNPNLNCFAFGKNSS